VAQLPIPAQELSPLLDLPLQVFKPRQTCFSPSNRDVFVISFGRMAAQGCAQHHAAKGSHRQFAKVASRQGCVSNDSSLLHVDSFLG